MQTSNKEKLQSEERNFRDNPENQTETATERQSRSRVMSDDDLELQFEAYQLQRT